MKSRERARYYCFDPTSGEQTEEYYEEDRDNHGPGCQCDDCMWVEEAHFRTYTPSVPEDAPMEEEV